MTQDKISALLGRPLSRAEQHNFQLYLKLAKSRVSDLFCVDICQDYGERRFPARNGYRTLNVPIFTEIESVKLDGKETKAYTISQNSNLYGEWFNKLVFDAPLHCQTIEIEADWGFYSIPADVQIMIAELFGIASDSLDSDTIQSKQVEDFRITFNKTKTQAFAEKYAATIAKYSSCINGNVQHGNVGYIL